MTEKKKDNLQHEEVKEQFDTNFPIEAPSPSPEDVAAIEKKSDASKQLMEDEKEAELMKKLQMLREEEDKAETSIPPKKKKSQKTTSSSPKKKGPFRRHRPQKRPYRAPSLFLLLLKNAVRTSIQYRWIFWGAFVFFIISHFSQIFDEHFFLLGGGSSSSRKKISSLPLFSRRPLKKEILVVHWKGHSVREVDRRIAYPLSSALLKVRGVKRLRTYSYLGGASFHLYFERGIERTRVELATHLKTLSRDLLPKGTEIRLAPSALAQNFVFGYTLESFDEKGRRSTDWSLAELREIQERRLRVEFLAVKGVLEVASIGGFRKEYVIRFDPRRLSKYHLDLNEMKKAIQRATLKIQSRFMEWNGVEYIVRIAPFVKKMDDLGRLPIHVKDGKVLYLKDVAYISEEPAFRNGGLLKNGHSSVGGLVMIEEKADPVEVIARLKGKIRALNAHFSLKKRGKKRRTLLKIIPFYDDSALTDAATKVTAQVLGLAFLFVIFASFLLLKGLLLPFLLNLTLMLTWSLSLWSLRVMGFHLNLFHLIAFFLYLAVLLALGILWGELNRLKWPLQGKPSPRVLRREISRELAKLLAPTFVVLLIISVVTSSAFLWTGRFAFAWRPLSLLILISSMFFFLLLFLLLPGALYSFSPTFWPKKEFLPLPKFIGYLGDLFIIWFGWKIWGILPDWISGLVVGIGIFRLTIRLLPTDFKKAILTLTKVLIILGSLFFIFLKWRPLGVENYLSFNFFFLVALLLLTLLFYLLRRVSFSLFMGFFGKHRYLFTLFLLLFIALLQTFWLGINRTSSWFIDPLAHIGFSPAMIRQTGFWKSLERTFPPIKTNFRPSIDEGTFLLVTSLPADTSKKEVLRHSVRLEQFIRKIPEVTDVTVLFGRTTLSWDWTPTSTLRLFIRYKPPYTLPPLPPQRLWRSHIRRPFDIWRQILKVTDALQLPKPPYLPISQAKWNLDTYDAVQPLNLLIYGNDYVSLASASRVLKKGLKQLNFIDPKGIEDRDKARRLHLLLSIDSEALNRQNLTLTALYPQLGLLLDDFQSARLVNNRGQWRISLSYFKGTFDEPQALKKLTVTTADGRQIPLTSVVSSRFSLEPVRLMRVGLHPARQLLFQPLFQISSGELLHHAEHYLEHLVRRKKLKLPPSVHYRLLGERGPLALDNLLDLSFFLPFFLFIFGLLFLRFRSLVLTLGVFLANSVALMSSFFLLWFYNHSDFLSFQFLNMNVKDVLHFQSVELNISVVVGIFVVFAMTLGQSVLIANHLQEVLAGLKMIEKRERRKLVLQEMKGVMKGIWVMATIVLFTLPLFLLASGRGQHLLFYAALPIVSSAFFVGIAFSIIPIFDIWMVEWEEEVTDKDRWYQRVAGMLKGIFARVS